MIDYSEAVWITPKKVINLKCSYCGTIMEKVYNRAKLITVDNVYCNPSCRSSHQNTLPKEEYEPAIGEGNYKPTSPEVCQREFGVINCLECTLLECKEKVIDDSESHNYTGIILDLKKQLCY